MERQSTVFWWWMPVILLVGLSFSTRLPAPWQMDVTNDEMHHLESWRNRYKSDDIYPLFLKKLEARKDLSPVRVEMVRKLYFSSSLVPHALLVLVDPQPPIFPTLAEITAKVTDSSLMALRSWSVAFSLLAIWVGYLAGREIAGRLCGLWLAILVCIGAVSQFFAGIGRPYALTQLTILLAIWAFTRRQKDQTTLPRFLSWCLLAQAVQWMAWAVVGPLVIVELVRQWRGGTALAQLARRIWWYALISVLLLPEMFIQARNPVVIRQGGLMPLDFVWWCFAVASPTGHLGSFGDTALYAGSAVVLALGIAGAIVMLRRRRQRQTTVLWLHTGLLAAALGGILASIIVGVTVRFEVSYITPWLVLTAVGLWALIPRPRAALITATAVLLAFGWLSLWHPQDPFARIADYDVRWSQVAAVMKQQQRPDGRWIGFAPSIACNIYRYGPFPEPIAPFRMEELKQLLDSGKVDTVPILLELNGNYPGMTDLLKRRIQVIKAFPNGSDGDYYVVGRVMASRNDLAKSQ